MSRHLIPSLLASLVLLCCQSVMAATDKFILVPNQDGTTGAIQVTSPKGSKIIKKPYSMIKVDAQGNFIVVKSNILCVGKEFDPVLANLPRPKEYNLIFADGQTLDDEALKVMDAILQQVAATQNPFVVLTGSEELIKTVQALLLKAKTPNLTILLDVVPVIPNASTVPQIKVSVQ